MYRFERVNGLTEEEHFWRKILLENFPLRADMMSDSSWSRFEESESDEASC